jgi:hypothetical protein
MFQLCFNLNRIHDSVGKALLRTANEARVTVIFAPDMTNVAFDKNMTYIQACLNYKIRKLFHNSFPM